MRKNVLLGIVMSIVSIPTFAGGILTNTNQNAAFLRNPARDAVIAIDGVYSNPAGIAFLPQGFHLSLSWQAAFQKRQMNASNQLFQANLGNHSADRLFEGTAKAPVIPSFQAAYVINDKWSVSAQFAVGGGGGKCEFGEGLPMFEELIGGSIMTAGAGATGYGLKQQLTGEQYFYGIQLGASYKLTENFSVFAGARGVLANCSYVGSISDITLSTAEIPSVAASTYFTGVSEQAAAAAAQYAQLGQAEAAAQYTAAAQKAGAAAYMLSGLDLDCSQSGFGITPIIGIDWKLGKWNLAAKYEFRTKIELENESNNSANLAAMATQVPAVSVYADGAKVRSDIPALLTVGAQYSATEAVRINAGFHYYWDKDAKGSPIVKGDNTWEALLGAEWDINDKFLVSAGVQRTQYGFDDADMADTNFNISSTALCVGGAYKFNDKMKLNIGYMHSFYGEHNFTNDNGSKCSYTRKNDVVGVSFDIRF